jgi:hypothetical protein
VTAAQYKDGSGRVCVDCRIYKAWRDYNRNAGKPQGYRSECRECQSKRAKKRYQDKKGSKK